MRTLLIIDANSLIHRAFHALPPITDSSGNPAGALYGLSSILIKLFREVRPESVVAAFDLPEPTFRKKEFSEYKAHRPEATDDLIHQIIAAKDIFAGFGIKTLESPGFEADDIIGTIVERFKGMPEIERLVILSGDLDTLQLVEGDRVVAWIPHKGVSEFTEYDEPAVTARFGLPPTRITDFKGLVGDKSDNIPGVYGVGPKTAVTVIQKYGPLEDLYDLSPAPKTEALKRILSGKESALMSKRLATISREVPIGDIALSDLSVSQLNPDKLIEFFDSYGFKSLSERIKKGGI